jgi:glycosyltransferase involved in cell wall biosynthesis
MNVQESVTYETGNIDEGELSASLEKLGHAPRLRGALDLGPGQVSGWLVDARSPSSPLQISLNIDGRTVIATSTPSQRGRVAKIDPNAFRFALAWKEYASYSDAARLLLQVICSDGEKYELVLGFDEGAPRDFAHQAKQLVDMTFGERQKLIRRPQPRPETHLEKAVSLSFTATSESVTTGRDATGTRRRRSDGNLEGYAALGASDLQPVFTLGRLASDSAAPTINKKEAHKDDSSRESVRLDATNAIGIETQSTSDAKGSNAPNIRAYVDVLESHIIRGWAWVENDPSASVEIIVQHRGRTIVEGLANDSRPDLVDAGVGTGRYGYAFSLPETDPREVSVLAKVGSTVVNVIVPEFLTSTPAVALTSAVNEKLVFEGHVDRLTRWGALGWAWLPQQPNESALVEAVHEGVVIGRAVANCMREDLVAHGKGTGNYGFEIIFDKQIRNEICPQFRILAPAQGHIPNSNILPALLENERAIPGRGSLEVLYTEHAKFTGASELFEEFDVSILDEVDRSKVDLIAFYLPQFHSIKENDTFWGKGFTEWRQLSRALPRYRGHYQPRIPRDLGFYTLTDIEPITRQAALAKAAGVNVFGFYYYWFNRTRVLDEPIEVFLRSGVEMKFVLIWANENWTRTWDGSESEVLLKQDYNEADERALIADWVRHFQDRRYYVIDGRPMFVIYNPKLIPDAQRTIARWRRILEAEHKINPLIFMAQTFGMRDPGVFGLDGAIEFPPHKLSDSLPGRPTPDAYSPEFAGRVIEYDDFVKISLAEDDPDYPLIKTVVPSWDNEARRPNRGFSLELSTPQKYQNWLQSLVTRALSGPRIGGMKGRAVVAVNAWNEWAEGAYLEPDIHFGAAYLNATARAVKAALGSKVSAQSVVEVKRRPRVTAIFPNFNHAKFLPERISSVLQQTVKPAEIIFLDDCSSDNSIEVARDLLQKSDIPYKIIENKANSGNVFKQWIKGIEEASSDWIWIAETDDRADRGFLENLIPLLEREDLLAAYGRISFIDSAGDPLPDLEGYYDGLRLFNWHQSRVVSAFKAFEFDFTVKNVIPNASGLVFKRPKLTAIEVERLFQYKFAGDWYFYALLLRGGKIGYSRNAKSYFRVNQGSASRSAFFTERHLKEHQMIVDDLRALYEIDQAAVTAHAGALAAHFPDKSVSEIATLLQGIEDYGTKSRPLRICIAAHSFETGGGELLPLALANMLRELGHHITYLVMEKTAGRSSLRSRLRPDISVLYWQNVQDRFDDFLGEHGIQILNSHNVSVEYQLFSRDIKISVPYIASLHGGYETVADLLKGPFADFLSKTVSKWLFLSEKNVKILTDHGIDRGSFQKSFNAVPRFAGNPTERKTFFAEHNIQNEAFVFVQCSRAIKDKGWRDAAVAVREASDKTHRPLHLVLIGDGPDLPSFREEFLSERQVTVLGHVDNPIQYFGCFDAAIFPSYFKGETFPLFILECFQAGLPVVASKIGEIPNLFEAAGGTLPGRLIDLRGTRPDPRELVSAIVEIVNDEKGLKSMQKAAKSIARKFDIDELARLYVDVFRDLVNSKKGSGVEASVVSVGQSHL